MGDPVRVIETAYACELDTSAWVEEMIDAVSPLLAFPKSIGFVGWVYDHRDLDHPRVHGFTSRKVTQRLHDATRAINEVSRRGGWIERAHRESFGKTQPLAATSALLAGGPFDEWWLPYFRRAAREVGDYTAVNAIHEPHRGLMIGAFTKEAVTVDATQAALWSLLCAHIASAMRLRQKIASSSLDPGENEAILTTGGRVEHATGSAKRRRSTEELIIAAKAIDRARGKLRNRDPDEAVTTWRALVDGRWSLVDYGVEGSRRYLVAKENVAPTPDLAKLSARQRQILFYVCQGHSNKLIAYELGLTPATVATHLRRAARIFKATSRAGLIARVYPLFVRAGDGDHAK